MPARTKNWVFTLNNPTPAEQGVIAELGESNEIEYLVYGRETGEGGTPYLQGYVIFRERETLASAKTKLSRRVHLEPARGTPVQASDYCKKDGDFTEHGALPPPQGRRSDWTHFREWVINHDDGHITDRDIFREFPGLFARYRDRIHEFVRLIREPVDLVDQPLRGGWQEDLWGILTQPPNDRTIRFYVDEVGNTGKSFFCRYALQHRPHEVQVLRVGKRDDLAHSIDPTKSIFLFDIPRGQMEFFQFSIAEALKDRMVYSPKYCSTMKILTSVPHVVIFCNELPAVIPLSADRRVVTHLLNL